MQQKWFEQWKGEKVESREKEWVSLTKQNRERKMSD